MAKAFEGCDGQAWVPLAGRIETTYTRWGRSACPAGAETVYSGYAAGKSAQHAGGGTNLLCLTSAPSFGPDYGDANQDGALLYGVEFNTSGFGLATLAPLHGYDANCAVCSVSRATTLVVPGTNLCPTGWTLEYPGYLMSTHYMLQASEYVCVDALPDAARSAALVGGGTLWSPTEVECGSLPCVSGGYVQNRELACVVCTR